MRASRFDGSGMAEAEKARGDGTYRKRLAVARFCAASSRSSASSCAVVVRVQL